jgi:hypothetical protein
MAHHYLLAALAIEGRCSSPPRSCGNRRCRDDQASTLHAVATGALGGPMAGLAPLIEESLGMERVPATGEMADGVMRAQLGTRYQRCTATFSWST